MTSRGSGPLGCCRSCRRRRPHAPLQLQARLHHPDGVGHERHLRRYSMNEHDCCCLTKPDDRDCQGAVSFKCAQTLKMLSSAVGCSPDLMLHTVQQQQMRCCPVCCSAGIRQQLQLPSKGYAAEHGLARLAGFPLTRAPASAAAARFTAGLSCALPVRRWYRARARLYAEKNTPQDAPGMQRFVM